MSLIESPSLNITPSAISSTRLPSQEYALSLVSLANNYAISASAPTNVIYLLDKSTLQNVHALSGHDNAITALRTVNLDGGGQPTLASSGRDGNVKVWDARSGSVSLQMSANVAGRSRSLLCFDVSADGRTVAAGTDLQGDDALIVYWDPRNPAAPIRTHASTHSDDITAVHFAPSTSSAGTKTLLSASSDGLISTSNAEEDDEDEAVLHVGNWGCSIAQAGWISVSAGAQAWAASDMETFSCWTDELDMLQDQDIRKPSAHSQSLTWVTDYLVGCHNSVASGSAGLGVFVGSNEGDVALITSSNLSNASAPWSLERVWTHGHVGIVRSFLYDEPNNVLVTGGEDSIINAWSCPPLGLNRPNAEDMDVDMDGGSPATASRKRGFDEGAGIDESGKKARMV